MKFFVIVLFSFFVLNSCSVGIDIVDYKYSPNGKYIAISYITSGGATTSFSVKVSIIESNKKLKPNKDVVFSGDKSTFIKIIWKNKDTLTIEHATDEKYVYIKDIKFRDINIEYYFNLDNKRYYGNSIDYKVPKGFYVDIPRDEYGWAIE